MGAVKKDSSGFAGLPMPGRYYIYNRREHSMNTSDSPHNIYLTRRYPERNAYSFFYQRDIHNNRNISHQPPQSVSALVYGNPWDNTYRHGHHIQPRKKYLHHNGHTSYKTCRRRLFPSEDLTYTKPSILVKRSYSYPQTTVTPGSSVDFTEPCLTPKFPVTKHVRILEPHSEDNDWNSDTCSVCSEYDNLVYVDSLGNYSWTSDGQMENNISVPYSESTIRPFLQDTESVQSFSQHQDFNRPVVNGWKQGHLDYNSSGWYTEDIQRPLSQDRKTAESFSQHQGYPFPTHTEFDHVESPLSLSRSLSQDHGYSRPMSNGFLPGNIQPFNLVQTYEDFRRRPRDNVNYSTSGFPEFLDSDNTPKFPVPIRDVKAEDQNTKRWERLHEEYDNVDGRVNGTSHTNDKLVSVYDGYNQYYGGYNRNGKHSSNNNVSKVSLQAYVKDMKALLALVEAEKLWLSQIEHAINQNQRRLYTVMSTHKHSNHVNSNHKQRRKKAVRTYSCCLCCY